MITEKPEGKKTASKIFTQDKETSKIFHAANNFQPVFFKIKSLGEGKSSNTPQLINCDGGVDAQPLTPLQWNVALQTKDWLQHWKHITRIHLYTKLMSVYQVELRNPEKYREPTNTVTGRPSDFYTFESRDDKGVT